MPPAESRARTISTTEIDSDRGRAAQGPSEVAATHKPLAARSAMRGCHVPATCHPPREVRGRAK